MAALDCSLADLLEDLNQSRLAHEEADASLIQAGEYGKRLLHELEISEYEFR